MAQRVDPERRAAEVARLLEQRAAFTGDEEGVRRGGVYAKRPPSPRNAVWEMGGHGVCRSGDGLGLIKEACRQGSAESIPMIRKIAITHTLTRMFDEGWESRLGWTHGLISAVPAEREIALRHHMATGAAVSAALQRMNGHWHRTNADYSDPAFRQSIAEHIAAQRYGFPSGIWQQVSAKDVPHWPGLPYVLNFLEWEARYPDLWTTHAKHWGTKESWLRALAVPGHEDITRERLAAMLELVTARAYRCKDRRYVGIARVIDSPELRNRVASVAEQPNPWARLHAAYVLDMLRHPERPNTRAVWERHVAGVRRTV